MNTFWTALGILAARLLLALPTGFISFYLINTAFHTDFGPHHFWALENLCLGVIVMAIGHD